MARPPKLRRIEYRIVESDNTILTLLQSHQIDFFYRASESQEASLRGIAGTRVVVSPFSRFADIGLNASTPALSDVRVRRALAYAIDRKALIAKVTHGIRRPGRERSAAVLVGARSEHYNIRLRSAARRARLLESAGWRQGADGIRRKDGAPLRLQLVTSPDP